MSQVADLKQKAARYTFDNFQRDKERLKVELLELKRLGVDLKALNSKRSRDWSQEEHRALRLDTAIRELGSISACSMERTRCN